MNECTFCGRKIEEERKDCRACEARKINKRSFNDSQISHHERMNKVNKGGIMYWVEDDKKKLS